MKKITGVYNDDTVDKILMNQDQRLHENNTKYAINIKKLMDAKNLHDNQKTLHNYNAHSNNEILNAPHHNNRI